MSGNIDSTGSIWGLCLVLIAMCNSVYWAIGSIVYWVSTAIIVLVYDIFTVSKTTQRCSLVDRCALLWRCGSDDNDGNNDHDGDDDNDESGDQIEGRTRITLVVHTMPRRWLNKVVLNTMHNHFFVIYFISNADTIPIINRIIVITITSILLYNSPNVVGQLFQS